MKKLSKSDPLVAAEVFADPGLIVKAVAEDLDLGVKRAAEVSKKRSGKGSPSRFLMRVFGTSSDAFKDTGCVGRPVARSLEDLDSATGAVAPSKWARR